MEHTPTSSHTDFNSKVTWWVLGLIGTLLLFGLGIVINKIESLDVELHTISQDYRAIDERVKNLERIITTSDRDNFDRLSKASELTTKVAELRLDVTYLKEQVRALSDRVGSLFQRVP